MDPVQAYFDPETMELMRTVLDDTWANLPPDLRATIRKPQLAESILAAAKLGERDPVQLRTHALVDCHCNKWRGV